jgi:hypothetical protein
MPGQDNCAIRREAQKDDAKDGVNKAEKGRADTVGYKANDDDQCTEPSHQASRHYEDSPSGGLGAQDGMGQGKPIGSYADPINDGQGIEERQAGARRDIGGQVRGDGSFIPTLASAGVGPQGLLDRANEEIDSQRQQDDQANTRQNGLQSRVGQIGKKIMTAEQNEREEREFASDGTGTPGKRVAPASDQSAANGQHVDWAHGRRRRQSDKKGCRKHVNVGNEHHLSRAVVTIRMCPKVQTSRGQEVYKTLAHQEVHHCPAAEPAFGGIESISAMLARP